VEGSGGRLRTLSIEWLEVGAKEGRKTANHDSATSVRGERRKRNKVSVRILVLRPVRNMHDMHDMHETDFTDMRDTEQFKTVHEVTQQLVTHLTQKLARHPLASGRNRSAFRSQHHTRQTVGALES
jgi:hypothetical protein